MLSYDVCEYYKDMIVQLDKFENKFSQLFGLASSYSSYQQKLLINILTKSERLALHATDYAYSSNDGTLISDFESLIQQFRKSFNFIKLVEFSGNLKSHVEAASKKYSIDDIYISGFIDALDSLVTRYQEYLQIGENEGAIYFCQDALDLIKHFYIIFKEYSNIIYILDSNNQAIEKLESKSRIEIQMLDIEYTFEEFVKHLGSIEDIYENLRLAMFKETESVQLKIIKIESGSLFSRLFGEEKIFQAIELLFTRIIDLVFAKFTHEGKLSRTCNLRDELKNTVEMAEQLKLLGYDISSTDEVIEKSFAQVAKQLESLALSAPRFKINGNDLSMSETSKMKYIEVAQAAKLISDKEAVGDKFDSDSIEKSGSNNLGE